MTGGRGQSRRNEGATVDSLESPTFNPVGDVRLVYAPRTCTAPDCGTVLADANTSSRCPVHAPVPGQDDTPDERKAKQ